MPRLVQQARFDRHFDKRSKQAQLLVRKLGDKELTVDQFGDAFDALLWQAHTDAVVLGRKRAGDHSPLGDDDQLLALDIKDSDADFLNGFLDRIRSGDLSESQIRANAQLYINKTRGTANEAFVNASDSDDLFEWRLGITEHCNDCIDLAAGSPYGKGELWTHPAMGDTECKVNCACYLVRLSDGREGFRRGF